VGNAAIVVVIGIELIFLAAAVGAAAGQVWILPPGQTNEHSLLIPARSTLRRLLGLALLLFFIASLLELLLRTADMSGQPLSEAYTELSTVLLKTHYGHFWLWRCGALILAALAWAFSLHPARLRGASYSAIVALVAVVWALSAEGHAGDDGFLSAANFANGLHILGGLLWGGGILTAMLIILPRLIRADARPLTAQCSLRLSALAAAALAMVIIPGVYNAWLQIGSWHGLWSTTYGRLLMIKVLLVMIMAALGALNRYRYVPALQRHAGLAEPRTLIPLPRLLRKDAPASSFLISLRVEAGLLLTVLLLAAALSQQVPAVHAQHEGMEGMSMSDD
jgi:putative copper export protein